MISVHSPHSAFQIQPSEKRLRSQDQVLIFTDVYTYSDSLYSYSISQRWFQVGALNLSTNELGYYRFSLDDARAMLKSGMSAPPWNAPQSFGIDVFRDAHTTGTEKGRYNVVMTPIAISSEIQAAAPRMRQAFIKAGFVASACSASWTPLVISFQREKATEDAAMAMVGVFKAGDVKAIVGADVNVTPVLKRLVKEGKITPVTPKTYRVTNPVAPNRSGSKAIP